MNHISFGDGKKPFVIIPGISLKSVLAYRQQLEKQFEIFTGEYKVYIIDRDEKLPIGYTIQDMAADTAAKMMELGIKDSFLYGTSQGGMLSMCIAKEFPDLVQKLIVASSSSKTSTQSDAVFQRWITLAKKKNPKILIEDFCNTVYTPEFNKKFQASIIEANANATDNEMRHFITLSKACMNFNIYDDLVGIKCPAFIIGAENDKVFGPRASMRIAEKLGCKLYIYPSYYHCVYDEAADYTEKIFNFCEEK